MTLSDLTADAVHEAMQEFDELGRERFLRKYGFHRARGYVLVHDGKIYDSKAIAGVAHQHVRGEQLAAAGFTGGEKSVSNRLKVLGFQVLEGKIVNCQNLR